MSNPTRDQWRDFHYGKKPERAKVKVWQLLDYGDRIVMGAYALCVHVMKERQSDGRQHRFKITPLS